MNRLNGGLCVIGIEQCLNYLSTKVQCNANESSYHIDSIGACVSNFVRISKARLKKTGKIVSDSISCQRGLLVIDFLALSLSSCNGSEVKMQYATSNVPNHKWLVQ